MTDISKPTTIDANMENNPVQVIVRHNLIDTFTRSQQDNRIFSINNLSNNRYDYMNNFDVNTSDVVATVSGGTSLGGVKLFFNGHNMINYLWRNKKFINKKGVINIYSSELRDTYYKIRNELAPEDTIKITNLQKEPKGGWNNVYSLRELQRYSRMSNVNEYYYTGGNITAFDMLHISAVHFIYAFNNREPLYFRLWPTNNAVVIDMPDKVFDKEYQKFILPKIDYDRMPARYKHQYLRIDISNDELSAML